MNRRGNAWLVTGIIVLIIFVLAGGYFAGKYFSLFSINGPATHNVTAFNQTWTVSGNWNDGSDYGRYESCKQTQFDDSNSGGINTRGASYNDRTICSFGEGVTVRLGSVDWSKQKSGVIHRSLSGTANGIGAGGTGISNTLFGRDGKLTVINSNPGSFNYPALSATSGDVFITNNGNVITVQSGSYAETFDARNPLYFEDSLGVSGSGGISFQYSITGLEIVSNTPAPVLVAPPASVKGLLSQIWDSLLLAFDKLKSLFTYDITGANTVSPGATQTYKIALTEPYAGSYDFTQGNYTQRFCAAALVDKNQNVVSETGFSPCTTSYNTNFTVSIPTGSFQDYAVIALMTETRQEYKNGAWSTTYQNKVIQQEALSLTSKVLISPPSATAPSGFKGFLAGIWNFLKGIFGL